MPKEIKGIFGAAVTPFNSANELDIEALKRDVDFLVEIGASHAIAYPMHFGESLTLSEAERRKAVQTVVDQTNGRLPVIVHVSWTGTDMAVNLAKHAQDVGADAVVCTVPYGFPPTPEGIKAHYEKLLSSVDIGVFAYNIPHVVRVEIPPQVAYELASKHDNFLGMKDASFNMPYFTEMLRHMSNLPRPFTAVVGVEHLIPTMSLGGKGAFSALAIIFPNILKQLYSLCERGAFAEARPLQYKVTQLLDVLSRYKYQASVKAVMEMRGRPAGRPRLPILPLTTREKEELTATLKEIGVWESEP